MVKPTVITPVMIAAVATISGLETAQAIPTNKEKIKVKTIKTINPHGRNASQQHAIAKEITIKRTESTIIIGVFTKVFLNVYEFIAQIQTKAVTINCKESIVYTF